VNQAERDTMGMWWLGGEIIPKL